MDNQNYLFVISILILNDDFEPNIFYRYHDTFYRSGYNRDETATRHKTTP